MKTDRFQHLFSATKSPAIAIVVAHPGDEVIGVGAQLRRWPQAHVIHVTDGAPRHSVDAWSAGFLTCEEYASARQREVIEALALAGLSFDQLHPLGFADQETSLHLVTLTEAILDKLMLLRPEIIITQPYEGGHPDHDSTAFAVHAACAILLRETGAAPAIVETTSYFNRAGIMATSEFLPRAKSEVKTLLLSENEKRFKQQLFACFKTQQKVLQYFPIGMERLRCAPHYDFTRPPHIGRLYYELSEWGTTGERWQKLAVAALHRLHVAARAPTSRAIPLSRT